MENISIYQVIAFIIFGVIMLVGRYAKKKKLADQDQNPQDEGGMKLPSWLEGLVEGNEVQKPAPPQQEQALMATATSGTGRNKTTKTSCRSFQTAKTRGTFFSTGVTPSQGAKNSRPALESENISASDYPLRNPQTSKISPEIDSMMGQESLESAIVLASLSVNKSSTAMLAQANMVSQNILQLLGN